jgi:VanZ family protein
MNRKRFVIVMIFLVVFWTMLILYLGSRTPKISSEQSGFAYSVIKKLDSILNFTDSKIVTGFENFLKIFMINPENADGRILVRKTAHFGIYMFLGIFSSVFSVFYTKKYILSFLFGFSFPVFVAVIDEFCQGFYNRGSSLNDVVIDGIGAFTGTVAVFTVFLIIWAVKWFKKRKNV